MSEHLIALYGEQEVGRLAYANDQLSFSYHESWRENHAAFPLSLSMPLTAASHPDKIVRPFISGLLPDNAQILAAWGKRFQVSPRNPYRLLSHVGEECAGAIQFLTPERLDSLPPTDTEPQVTWLSESDLIERIDALVADHSKARRLGDQGQFSLAGAQPKTGLYYDSENNRWGIPHGHTPTTHILKPNVGAFDSYDLNEHLCLRLAARLGLPTATSSLKTIGGTPVLIVERFDRILLDGRMQRIHQEDSCQALSCPPTNKYEHEGGPSAKAIFTLIRDFSHRPQEDVQRFLDALLFNWIIGGTDAHAKNYSFLLAEEGQVRLAPLYDLSSALPYPRDIPIQKARLAMKIGSTYELARIDDQQWKKAAKTWQIPQTQLEEQRENLSAKMPHALHTVVKELTTELPPHQDSSLLPQLRNAILSRTTG